jgi:TatD DNase family protein
MIRSASGQAIIAAIPDDRLLTETDGPFVKHNGRPVHPFDMASILPALAKLRGTTPAELRTLILQNFRRAVSISADTARE